MKIRNIQVEFDFLDADDIEKFEDEAKRVEEKCEKKDIETLSYSEAIRKECKIIEDFFDNVFGEGISKKIFKEKKNLIDHINAFQDIVNEKVKKQEELQKTLNRYLPNREQRRNKRK